MSSRGWAQLLYGNAYIYVKRGYDYSISELILCSTGSVTHDIYNHTYTIADNINGISQTLTEGELKGIKEIPVVIINQPDPQVERDLMTTLPVTTPNWRVNDFVELYAANGFHAAEGFQTADGFRAADGS